jgi:hypothetical protein
MGTCGGKRPPRAGLRPAFGSPPEGRGARAHRRRMSGLGYESYEDVRLEKARFEAVVEQFTSELLALTQPMNNSFNADQAAFNADWQEYLTSWNSFYQTGTDQSSTLWFPNFPDSTEWSELMQYEAQLKTLQTRAATVYPKGSFVAVTPSASATWSLWSLYPALDDSANATLTSLTWVAAAGVLVVYGGPILSALESYLPRKSHD